MNQTLLSGALLVAALAALTSTAAALPQGKDKPKAADTKAPAAGKGPANLAALLASFSDEESKAEKAMKEKKLTAIEAYITANAAAPDRAKALSSACVLAMELDKWGKARSHADAFLKDFPEHKNATTVRLHLGSSLAHEPGKETAAREVLSKVMEDTKNVGASVEAGTMLADLLAESGDVEGAKKALQDLGEKHPNARGLKEQVLGPKIADLEQFGQEPKPIDVKTLDGKPLSLANYKGKVVLIDFWATWCGPCIAEMPNVIATYKKLHDRGFEIIAISLDQDEQALRDFIEEHGMPWPQFFDGKGWKNEVAQLYGVKGIPKTYLLDRDGKVQGVGLRGAALGRKVERLLGTGAAKAAPAAGPKETGAKEAGKDKKQ